MTGVNLHAYTLRLPPFQEIFVELKASMIRVKGPVTSLIAPVVVNFFWYFDVIMKGCQLN